MPRTSKDLENFKILFNDIDDVNEELIELMDIDAKFIYDLNENISYIVDERIDGYVIHSLESIVLSVIFATLANCNTFIEIHLFMKRHFNWLNKHIKCDNVLPSISTVKKVMAFINPKELENICLQSLKTFFKNNYDIYRNKYFKINDVKSMDGKVAISSERNSSEEGSIVKMNAMSLYSQKNDICEATEFIEEKSNKIPAGISLLKQINIKDCVIVFDAMSTQRKNIDYIVENKLHWYLDAVFKEDASTSFLKNSQKNLNIIRKFCLKILKLFKEQSKFSMNSIRFVISMDFLN